MKRFYLTNEQFTTNTIDGDEFNHMKNVMRMNSGDKFIAFIGDEFDYECTINEIKKNYISFSIDAQVLNLKNPKLKIDLFQSLAKGEKMELVTQKCTEIGIRTIYPLFVKNCDVKANSNKPARLEKIVISACKQCGRSQLTEVKTILTLQEALPLLKTYDLVLFANETEQSTRIYDQLEKNKNAKSIALIVGPEGGFTPDEIEQLNKISTSITFGSRILRTETASIYLSSIVCDYFRS